VTTRIILIYSVNKWRIIEISVKVYKNIIVKESMIRSILKKVILWYLWTIFCLIILGIINM
jgi:hypothetical protein